jgi:hypothetical protein
MGRLPPVRVNVLFPGEFPGERFLPLLEASAAVGRRWFANRFPSRLAQSISHD